MIDLTEKNGALIFTAHIVPRASKSEIAGVRDGALKIRIASPPVDGAANAELVKFLSKTFGVAKSDIEIIVGQTSKSKRVRISLLTAEKFLQLAGLE